MSVGSFGVNFFISKSQIVQGSMLVRCACTIRDLLDSHSSTGLVAQLGTKRYSAEKRFRQKIVQ
jgi:hypothetical protein